MSAPLYTRAFWLISAAHVFLAVAILSIPPVQARFVRSLGGGELQIGAVYAIGLLSGLLLRPLAGWVLDRQGRRPAFLIGGLITAAGFPAFLCVERLGPLLDGLRFLHGVGMGTLFATLFTYASDISPPARRTEGLAVFGAVGLFAIGVGPMLGEWIVVRHGFPAYFVVMGALSAVGLAISLVCPETRPAGGLRGKGLADWRHATLHRPLRALWAVSLLWGVVVGAYFAFLEPLCVARRLPGVGHFFLPYGAAAVLLRLVGRGVPDRLGPARLLGPSLLLQASGVLLLALASRPSELWLAGTLCGMGHGYVFPIVNALAVGRCDPERRGVVITLYTMAVDCGGVFFTPLAGWAAAHWGYRPLFVLCAALLAAAALLFRAWDPRLLLSPVELSAPASP